MTYLLFLIERLRECVDTKAHPYERKVCLWAFNIRLTFIVTAVLLWWTSTAWLPEAFSYYGWAWRLYCAWGVGWIGAFIWADFGLEEWYREIFVGSSNNPNLFPTQTLEAYGGFKRGGYSDDAENERLFNDNKMKANLLWERSGQPFYDDVPREQWTWAMRLHHRFVRPRLVANGVPGYRLLLPPSVHSH